MKKNFFLSTIFFSLILLLFQTSCKKEDDKDTENPTVTVAKPTSNQAFANGDTVKISAAFADNEALHEVGIHVTNLTTDSEFFHYHNHDLMEAKTFSKDTFFIVDNGGTATNFNIEFVAIDHLENESEKVVMVTTTP